MSTSSEPDSPSRPESWVTDDPGDAGIRDGTDHPETWTEADEGPLDPSAFDGLFDDLGPLPPADRPDRADPDGANLLAAFLATPLIESDDPTGVGAAPPVGQTPGRPTGRAEVGEPSARSGPFHDGPVDRREVDDENPPDAEADTDREPESETSLDAAEADDLPEAQTSPDHEAEAEPGHQATSDDTSETGDEPEAVPEAGISLDAAEDDDEPDHEATSDDTSETGDEPDSEPSHEVSSEDEGATDEVAGETAAEISSDATVGTDDEARPDGEEGIDAADTVADDEQGERDDDDGARLDQPEVDRSRDDRAEDELLDPDRVAVAIDDPLPAPEQWWAEEPAETERESRADDGAGHRHEAPATILDLDHQQSRPDGPVYASPPIRVTTDSTDLDQTAEPDSLDLDFDLGFDRDLDRYPDRAPDHADIIPNALVEPLPAEAAPTRSGRPRLRRLWVVSAFVLFLAAGIGAGAVLASQGRSDDGGSVDGSGTTTVEPTVDGQATAPSSAETPAGAGESTVADDPSPDVPASDQTAADPDEPAPTSPTVTDPTGDLQLTSLRFAPGTEELTEESDGVLQLLATTVAGRPDAPISVAVRTYTEATPAEDLALSVAQAAALADRLVALGADRELITTVGLGRSLLSPAQPVPTFVAASAGLRPSPVRDLLDRIGPFAIGTDARTGRLRPESELALDRLAQTMAADAEDRTITLAGYSFDRPDPDANRAQATAAVEAAVAHLTERGGVDPTRIETIVLGEAPYAVPDRVANHIDLHFGDSAVFGRSLATLMAEAYDFAPEETDLSAEATAAIDDVGATLANIDRVVVIEVHSYDGPSDIANVELSVARAQSIGQGLARAGLSADRIRLHARGASPQFEADGRTSRLVATLVPAGAPA